MSLLKCFKRRFLKGSKAGAGAAAAKISNSGNIHSSRPSAPSVNDTSHSTLNSLVLASVLMDDEGFDTPTTKNIAATTMAADPTDDAGKPASTSSSNNKDLDSLTDNPYKLTPNPNHTSESTYQGSVFNSSSSSDNGSSHSSSSASYSSSGSSYSSSSSSDSGSSSSSGD